MLPLLKHTAAVSSAPVGITQIEGYPGSFYFWVQVKVPGFEKLEDAVNRCAPATLGASKGRFNSNFASLKPISAGMLHKSVLLVCFGKFMHQRRVEKYADFLKKGLGLADLNIRTLLAVGGDHSGLVLEKNIQRMRFVSLLHKVTHFNETHVPTLHQINHGHCVTNEIMLEPYNYGWSAEHIFGLEKDIR